MNLEVPSLSCVVHKGSEIQQFGGSMPVWLEAFLGGLGAKLFFLFSLSLSLSLKRVYL
jgi:hypothetical protein